MKSVNTMALSVLFSLFLISCGGTADDPAPPVDGGQDAGAGQSGSDAEGDDAVLDGDVICECEEETPCCDGCHPINVGGECGDDAPLCTDNICTTEGECRRTVLPGWCLTGDGTAEEPWQCADTATDPANCGTCGRTCPQGATCIEGDCFVEVTGITVEPETLSLPVGDQHTLNASITPPNASDQRVTWTSDNETVATVDEDGTVTALEQGTANIIVTTFHGDFSASAAVFVVVPVTGVTLSSPSLTLFLGETEHLLATIVPAEATLQAVVWESAAPGVATVDEDGLVEGVGVGKTTITVHTEDGGHTDSVEVTVTSISYQTIQAGTFTMGSPANELGRDAYETQHQVTITRSFLIMDIPVTQDEWAVLMGNNPSHFTSCGSCPVEQITWYMALDYANALSASEGLSQCFDCSGSDTDVTCSLKEQYDKPQDCPGYRLPTEAEWEYAARAGSTTAFHTGDLTGEHACDNMDKAGWYDDNSNNTTHPVRLKQPNNWGLYDMHGNVQEWIWDWMDWDLGSGDANDPYGPATGTCRAYRGGFWGSFAKFCRAGRRYCNEPYRGNNAMGFRLVRTL